MENLDKLTIDTISCTLSNGEMRELQGGCDCCPGCDCSTGSCCDTNGTLHCRGTCASGYCGIVEAPGEGTAPGWEDFICACK